jgi:hypothetical protein
MNTVSLFPLLAMMMAAAACAAAPSGRIAANAVATEHTVPTRLTIVTGSRIPQSVPAHSDAVLQTLGAATLQATGQAEIDLGAALRNVDPVVH